MITTLPLTLDNPARCYFVCKLHLITQKFLSFQCQLFAVLVRNKTRETSAKPSIKNDRIAKSREAHLIRGSSKYRSFRACNTPNTIYTGALAPYGTRAALTKPPLRVRPLAAVTRAVRP